MTFTDTLWTTSAPLREAIDELPFLHALENGTLDTQLFRQYLQQDALYLDMYARVLSAAAMLAPTREDSLFWTHQALSCLQVEHELHATQLNTIISDPEKTVPFAQEASPTCAAYTSYLLSLVASGSYSEVIAAVLPCFWIYDDVGRRMLTRVGDPTGHAFGAWIATYGNDDFTAATQDARAAVDRVAETANSTMRARMRVCFDTATRYEWMFWDAAWRNEQWPLPLPGAAITAESFGHMPRTGAFSRDGETLRAKA